MDIWNSGPYDNSEAEELLDDIRSHALPLSALMPEVGQRHITEDQGATIVVLAHLAAAEPGELPDGIGTNDIAELRTPEARERLRQALEAVLADGAVSDLYTRWQGEGQDKLLEWKAQSHVSLK